MGQIIAAAKRGFLAKYPANQEGWLPKADAKSSKIVQRTLAA
jgi:hypothetical protein